MATEHFVDLKAANAVSLELSIPLSTDEAARVVSHVGTSLAEARARPFWDTYEKSGRNHSVVARFAGDADNTRVTLEYSLRRFGDNQGRSTEKVADALSSVLQTARAEVAADFEYSTANWRSVVTLPSKIDSSANMPFDEIRGYRFAKRREDKGILYSVVLDLIGDAAEELISLHVGYGHVGRMPIGEFVAGSLLRAVQIASPFVRSFGETSV